VRLDEKDKSVTGHGADPGHASRLGQRLSPARSQLLVKRQRTKPEARVERRQSLDEGGSFVGRLAR